MLYQTRHITDRVIIVRPEYCHLVLMCEEIDFPIVVNDRMRGEMLITSEREYDYLRFF